LFLDLNGAAPGEVVRVQVAKDRAAVRQGVETFIEAYNGVVGQIRSLTAYDLETQQGSILTGDSSVRSIYAQLRNGLISAVDGASETYSYLVEIGLESDSDGALTLDGARFDDAMSADFEGVVALLSGAAEGLGQTVEGMLGAGGLLIPGPRVCRPASMISVSSVSFWAGALRPCGAVFSNSSRPWIPCSPNCRAPAVLSRTSLQIYPRPRT